MTLATDVLKKFGESVPSDVVVSQVFDLLMSQRFQDWFDGEFTDYIAGEENSKSEAEIKASLKTLLGRS